MRVSLAVVGPWPAELAASGAQASLRERAASPEHDQPRSACFSPAILAGYLISSPSIYCARLPGCVRPQFAHLQAHLRPNLGRIGLVWRAIREGTEIGRDGPSDALGVCRATGTEVRSRNEDDAGLRLKSLLFRPRHSAHGRVRQAGRIRGPPGSARGPRTPDLPRCGGDGSLLVAGDRCAGCCCWLLGVAAGSARRACCVPALRSRARRLAVRWPWPHLAQAITGGRLSSKLYGCHRPCHRPRHQHSPQTEWWAIRVAGQSITSYLGIFGGRHRQILPGSCQVPASSPRPWPV